VAWAASTRGVAGRISDAKVVCPLAVLGLRNSGFACRAEERSPSRCLDRESRYQGGVWMGGGRDLDIEDWSE
jgi:hypothetical protein